MMKKRGIMILLLLITFINYAGAEILHKKDEALVLETFEKTESDFKSFNMSLNGEINNEFMKLNELEKMTEKYIHDLNFKENYREVIEEEHISKVSIYGQVGQSENITLIFYSYLDKKNDENLTTIFIDINESKDYEEIEEITSKISKTLELYDIEARNTSCIVGVYEGKLGSEYKNEIIKDLTKQTDSKQVENLIEEELISYSLYSKYIKDYIYTGNNKMNLNIAIRYDEYRDQTNIFIASPIITTGY